MSAQPISIVTNAVIIAFHAGRPFVRVVDSSGDSALPSGLVADEDRTITESIRRWVKSSTSQDLGYVEQLYTCLLYTSPSPRDQRGSRMPSSA